MSELAKWDTFYSIVGSSAGALIGLQFVVLTLVAQRPSSTVAEGGAAFASPTIVHFGVVLLLSAILRAPWQSLSTVATVWGVLGFAGVVYSLIVCQRMKKLSVYKPVFEDWLCHFLLPLTAYAILALSYFVIYLHTHEALFGVAASALILLFAAIHNAWDSVTYHVWTVRRTRTGSNVETGANNKAGDTAPRQNRVERAKE
jgi:hypothetical protein